MRIYGMTIDQYNEVLRVYSILIAICSLTEDEKGVWIHDPKKCYRCQRVQTKYNCE